MKYRTTVDLANLNSSQSAVARMILERLKPNDRVLDVGCAAGDLGAELASHGFEVIGIERDPGAAAISSKRLSKVYVSDLATLPLGDIVDEKFDAVIFGDVLEHLVDPARVLRSAQQILNPDGLVIASIPNVTHGSIRLAIALGHWEYTDEGLLDRTHLRFFTLDSIKDLFAEVGFVIDSVQATIVTPLLDTPGEVPQEVLDWILDQPGTSDFQYIIEAHVGTAPDNQDLEVLRLADQFVVETTYAEHQEKRASELSEQNERAEGLELQLGEVSLELQRIKGLLDTLEEDRMRILTVRDYALGTEQAHGRAQFALAENAALIGQLRREIVETHQHLADAIADSQKAHARLADALQNQNAPLSSRVRRKAGNVARKAGLR